MPVPTNAKRPVVFLDRDGTLNVEVGYIHDLTHLQLIKGAGQAIKCLNQAGVAAVLVTNQSGAARGYYPEQHIKDLNQKLCLLLAAGGAHLDALYYCPHLSDGDVPELSVPCNCRKPAGGLIERALREHRDLDANRAYVVGDKATDIELARNCHMKSVLVKTGYGQQVIEGSYQWPVEPDYTAADIVQACDWILRDLLLK